MMAEEYLTLRSVHLKSPQEWTNPGDGICFLFPKDGTGVFDAGPVCHRLKAGDVLVLNGSPQGTLRLPAKGELVFLSFSICLEQLLPLMSAHQLCLLQNVVEGFKRSKVYLASSALASQCHKLVQDIPTSPTLDNRCRLLGVVTRILETEFQNAQSPRAGFIRPDEHLMQVFEKLSINDLLNLSVGDLAGRFGCSRRHLSRLFHHHFGLSVAGLRMELRLLRAVSLLRDPDAKVIRVAEDCGFNHLGLFNACFKRRFGVSPSGWRKNIGHAAGGNHQDGKTQCPLVVQGICPWAGKVAEPIAAVRMEEKSPRSKRRLYGLNEASAGVASQACLTSCPV